MNISPLVLALPLLTACYAYVPVEPAALRLGMDVRTRVTAVAAPRVAPLLGMSDARLLTGRLIESGADGMIIEVPSLGPASSRARPRSCTSACRSRVRIFWNWKADRSISAAPARWSAERPSYSAPYS